jgi:hypothetical protein
LNKVLKMNLLEVVGHFIVLIVLFVMPMSVRRSVGFVLKQSNIQERRKFQKSFFVIFFGVYVVLPSYSSKSPSIPRLRTLLHMEAYPLLSSITISLLLSCKRQHISQPCCSSYCPLP